MPDFAHWSVFLTATIILLIIPGPSVLFVVARGIDRGFRAAMLSAIGLACGDLFQVLCAAIGLSALLSSSIVLFVAVKYAGAGYLIFLGIRRIKEKDALLVEDVRSKGGSERSAPARILVMQGFYVNALNPKTALFFLALLPQFVAPNVGPASLQILAFGMAFVALGFLTNCLYGRIGGNLGILAKRNALFQRTTRYLGGGTLVALGVAAALTPSHRSVQVTR